VISKVVGTSDENEACSGTAYVAAKGVVAASLAERNKRTSSKGHGRHARWDDGRGIRMRPPNPAFAGLAQIVAMLLLGYLFFQLRAMAQQKSKNIVTIHVITILIGCFVVLIFLNLLGVFGLEK
jgi:hypothetical protein